MPKRSKFIIHTNSLSENALTIWREGWIHLRALSGDIWASFKFFITASVASLGAVIVFWREKPNDLAIPLLALVGLVVTLLARGIYYKQREYYVRMLAKQLLLEKQLGFDDLKVGTLDLSFPWGTYSPGCMYLLEKDSEKWIQEELNRKSSVRWKLMLVYDLILTLHIGIIIAAIVYMLEQP